MIRPRITFSLLAIGCLLTLVLNVCCGSVHIPLQELGEPQWSYILWHIRMPAAITAVTTGASLGACGLLLQSYFRNPLAGPSILGITNGANLMVALVMLGGYSFVDMPGLSSMGLSVAAALVGAFAILGILLALGRYVRQVTTLLIVGILISYLTSALISLLSYQATQQGLQQMLLWGLGDFGGVGLSQLPYYCQLSALGLLGALLMVKPLNGWMQGELYAQNLGIDIRRTKYLLLGITGLLAAITTAWCGPIAFVGLSMPHAARLLLRTDDHRLLLPASMLCGALCCGACLWLSSLPSGGTLLPINALTPLFGIPIIIHVLLRR